MMRIAIWAVGLCMVVTFCSVCLTCDVAKAEPLLSEEAPSENITTPEPGPAPETEPETPTGDPDAQAPNPEPDPEFETESEPPVDGTLPPVVEQNPEPGTVTPASDTPITPPEHGSESETISPAGDSDAQVAKPALGDEALMPSGGTPEPTSPNPPGGEITRPTIGKTSLFKTLFNNLEMEFMLTAGLRKDDFQWSIAGNGAGSSPNILSELTWSDVDSYQLSFTNRNIYKRNFYFRWDLNYAFVQNGRIQDSDYREDDRRQEYSRSISDSSGDQIWDISLAGGYPFFFLEERFMVAPLFGISYHVQNFRITDGNQVLTSPGVAPLGPLEGLDSTYRTAWYGPWVGCDLRYRLADESGRLKQPMEFGLSFELHYADYEAEANWNLRDDFEHPVSFEHEATGYGVALAGEWLIGLSKHWDVVFRSTYQYWRTSDGTDRAHNSDGTVDRSRLNEVDWHNHSMMVGANFHF